jgi:DNA-binding winged helix-turn-helix (wHTH) protein
MKAECPCCGGKVSPHDILIDEAVGGVAHKGRIAHFAPRRLAVFKLLLDGYPEMLTKDDILDKVFGERGRDKERLLSTMLAQMRPDLERLGLQTVTSYGVGYRLAFVEENLRPFVRSKNRRRKLDTGDIAAIRMLRERDNLRAIDIAKRLNITSRAAMLAVCEIEREKARVVA